MDSRDPESFIQFQLQYYDWEVRAKNILGDRFCYSPGEYPLSAFVDGDDKLFVRFLSERFGARPEKHLEGIDDEYLFKRIVVFGQEPSACVARQAWSCGLRNLAFAVEQYETTPPMPDRFYRLLGE